MTVPRGVPGSQAATRREALKLSNVDRLTRAQIAVKMNLTEDYLRRLGVPEYPPASPRSSSPSVVNAAEVLRVVKGRPSQEPMGELTEESNRTPVPIGGTATRYLAEHLAALPPFAGSEITEDRLVHDAALCALLGQIMREAPDGVVRKGVSNPWDPPGMIIGSMLFTGGTALAMCHGVTERWSEDVDFVCVPDSAVTLTRKNKRRARRTVLEAAEKALAAEIVKRGQDRIDHDISINIVKYGSGEELAIDLAWRRDFSSCLELLGISTQPATSLLERFADASHLPLAARGPHMVPCVGVPYIAATKLDAQHLRAVQGQYQGMTDRARDVYDLARIALSGHADEVRETVPVLSEVIKTDVRNRGMFPRPANGYANSPAFQRGSDGVEALRAGYRDVQAVVYGTQITFDDAIELVRELDPR